MCDCQGEPNAAVKNVHDGEKHGLKVVCQRCGEEVSALET